MDGPSGGEQPVRLSDELERWLATDHDKTLGGLLAAFGEKGFALLLVVLLGVPALPIPTGGVTHVFELVAVLVALQLMAGRQELWLPRRWRGLGFAGDKRERFLASLVRLIRRLERISRPRLTFLFHHRLTDIVFGLLTIALTAGAFLAPPFSGLDTLPALGVVVLSLGVLLEDVLVAIAGLLLGLAGVILEIVLGSAAVHGVSSLL